MRHSESGLQRKNGYVDTRVLVPEGCHTPCTALAPRYASHLLWRRGVERRSWIAIPKCTVTSLLYLK